jgi:hypothetical protein
VRKRLLAGSWSRTRGVPGPDEPPQLLIEDEKHSYLLSVLFCASEMHKGPSTDLRGRLEHHGHTATHWIRLAWPCRQPRELWNFLSGTGSCRCRPVVYVQELGLFDFTGHSNVKVSVMTPAKRSRVQADISDS